MQILLANPRGFCAGVERAIAIVERALEKFGAPIYVRHEVVHNRYVVDDLRAKGLARQGQGVELAAGAGRDVQRRRAPLRAERGGDERDVEAAAVDAGAVTKGQRRGQGLRTFGQTIRGQGSAPPRSAHRARAG